MKLKQILFNYISARQPRREPVYPDYNRVKSVLLLFESEWMERNPQIRSMVLQLQEDDKEVVIWGYCKKDKVVSPNLPESRILGTNDFRWLQKPKADVLQFLEHHEMDLLIDLTEEPILPLQYIALFARAKFKIGAFASPIYDMVVQSPEQVSEEYTFQQIIHYLKLIKSAD